LVRHIRERLPELKSHLNLLTLQTEQELASYGDSILFSGPAHQSSLVLRLITRFAQNFTASIDGTYGEIALGELCGGARLYYIFNSVFGRALEVIDPNAGNTVPVYSVLT
jgi:dynamin 1-like protein